MRPAIYGAYHHITVLGKENEPCDHKYDVTGSLCENCDKFAIDRFLPEIEMGDYLFIVLIIPINTSTLTRFSVIPLTGI
jgi:diaminopimelate decarboxylase